MIIFLSLIRLINLVVLISCFVCGFLDGDTDAIPGFVVCLLIALVDLFILAYKSYQKKTRGRMYATVIRGGARRVEDVVSATDLPYDVVQKDLRKFAKKGKGDFQGAYFNESTQEIIFTRNVPAANWNNVPANAAPPVANWNNVPANAAPPVANWNNAPANAPAQPAAPRNVCPACGASVARVGNGVCEYCGTPLN